MSVEIKTRIRRTNNLLVQDTIKYKNDKIVFGTTKIIRKIFPWKIRIKNWIINSKIGKTYRKILRFIMKYKNNYHLKKGLKLEKKAANHLNKHVLIKHKFSFFDLNKIEKTHNFKVYY